jgi:diguanylate cyclase (GGDEF)-like protein
MVNLQRDAQRPAAAQEQASSVDLLSRVFACMAGLAVPIAYFSLQFQYHQGTLGTEANINATIVANKLVENLHQPDLLDIAGGELELLESVEHAIDHNEYNERYETRALLNSRRQPQVQAGAAALPWPVIEAISAVRHGNRTLGYFRIQRSLAPVLMTSAWFALLGGALAWALWFVMRRVPMLALQKAQQRLSHLSRYDQITDLPNRTELEERIAAALQQANRAGSQVALLYLDLDRFKVVNDRIGHRVGNELLRIAAQRIVNSVRTSDTVARLASDEFVLLLPEVLSKQQACAVAEKLLAKFRSPFVVNGQSFLVTLSIGIAYGPGDGTTAEQLLRNADSALHCAKQSQGDNFQLYDRSKHDQLQARLRMEQLLHTALANNELLLHYQPIVSAGEGAITGVEALLRWNSPEFGLVPPIKFIDILEESGLIVPVGAWVLEEACRQARQWFDDGIGALTLSVNVSARQFKDPELVATVHGVIERTGFPARLLQLELTESMLMNDPVASAARMRELASHGIRIAIDDFGTGYSSLAYLQRFSLDTLKVDRSFVKDMLADSGSANIVAAVIGLAHNLNLSVTAEGVETVEQQDALRAHQCDTMQGYLFAKPMPAAEATAFMRGKRRSQTAVPALQLVVSQ